MKSIRYLYAAYVATWVIHASYLGSLIRRYERLRQRLKEISAK